MLGSTDAPAVRGLRPGDARPRRRGLHRRGRRAGRARAPGPRPRRPGCGSRSSPTTRSRPPARVAEHLRELGVDAAPDGRGHLGPGRRPGAARSGSAPAPGSCCSVPTGCGRRSSEEGLVAGPVSEEDAAAVVTGYGPDVLWRDIMRAAVRIRDGLPWVASNTDLTIPTAYGVAPGHGVLVETIRRLQRRGARRGRQAGAAAARRDRPPGRRRAAADGRRPARHRHRGCPQRRARLAAGADRGDRAGRAGRRRGPRSGRRTSPPTWPGCSRRTGAAGRGRRGGARGLAARRSSRAAWR